MRFWLFIVFFIIAVTGGGAKISKSSVSNGSCWAERVEDLKKEAN